MGVNETRERERKRERARASEPPRGSGRIREEEEEDQDEEEDDSGVTLQVFSLSAQTLRSFFFLSLFFYSTLAAYPRVEQ